jgi:hypothetical protein
MKKKMHFKVWMPKKISMEHVNNKILETLYACRRKSTLISFATPWAKMMSSWINAIACFGSIYSI